LAGDEKLYLLGQPIPKKTVAGFDSFAEGSQDELV